MNDTLEILLNGQQFKKLHDKKYHQILKKYGLTKLEIEILLFFEINKRYDTAKDIVDFKYFTKSHVSKAITSLINTGYLYPKADEHDRRCVHLKVSEDAKHVIQEAKEIRDELIGILFKDISLYEQEVIFNVVKKITTNITEAIEEDI